MSSKDFVAALIAITFFWALILVGFVYFIFREMDKAIDDSARAILNVMAKYLAKLEDRINEQSKNKRG